MFCRVLSDENKYFDERSIFNSYLSENFDSHRMNKGN